MSANWNPLVWDRRPGHYEVYYLSATDRASGLGLWIRYTMVAPLPATGEPATAALWFMAMDPEDLSANVGRKETFPIDALSDRAEPFELRIGDSVLDDRGMRGGFADVSWELSWEPNVRAYEHVHPLLRRTGLAKTVLTLPHADLEIAGRVSFGGREVEIADARGGQAHLWGSKHALRWAWAHCNDFETQDGEPAPGDFFDAASVYVPRFGRELGPNTPVVGRFGGVDFGSTNPLRVLGNDSHFSLTSWELEARDGARKLGGEVVARREDLVGVTYHDPDGDLAYCYNAEIATMRLNLFERSGGDWELTRTLVAPRRAHFEFAQREPLPDMPLHVR